MVFFVLFDNFHIFRYGELCTAIIWKTICVNLCFFIDIVILILNDMRVNKCDKMFILAGTIAVKVI